MLFSIITVCLNAKKTISRTIESVIRQENVQLEYIIIDGNSIDGTVDIIRSYEKYIDYWISEPDGGVYDAMNKGVSLAKGDVLAFVNSDDWYEPNALELVEKKFLSFPQADVICASVNRWRMKKRISTWVPNSDSSMLKYGWICCHQGMFTKKNCFDEIGNFNVNYRIAADYDWVLRAYYHGFSFVTCLDIVANYSLGGISSQNYIRTYNEETAVALKYAEEQKLCDSETSKIREVREKFLDCCFIQHAVENKLLDDDLKKEIKKELGFSECSIWGGGKDGGICIKLLKWAGCTIEHIWDNAQYNWGIKIYDIPVENPENCKNYKKKIIITAIRHEEEIYEQLVNLGLEDNCIRYTELASRVGEKIGRCVGIDCL